jgi:hypothetical protein
MQLFNLFLRSEIRVHPQEEGVRSIMREIPQMAIRQSSLKMESAKACVNKLPKRTFANQRNQLVGQSASGTVEMLPCTSIIYGQSAEINGNNHYQSVPMPLKSHRRDQAVGLEQCRSLRDSPSSVDVNQTDIVESPIAFGQQISDSPPADAALEEPRVCGRVDQKTSPLPNVLLQGIFHASGRFLIRNDHAVRIAVESFRRCNYVERGAFLPQQRLPTRA